MSLNFSHSSFKKITTQEFIVGLAAALVIALIALVMLLIPRAYADTINNTDFVMTWKTDNPGSTNNSSITLPMNGLNYSVDWNNDGVADETGLSGTTRHDFGTPGVYKIRISGDHGGINHFYSNDDPQKLLEVNQWGTGTWDNMSYAFVGASNLTVSAVDTPNMTGVTRMNAMFADATSFNSDISNWDVSGVSDFGDMFNGAAVFNQPLNSWDTSNATNMYGMFNRAAAFNQPLNNWDVSKVENTSYMFDRASAFNQNISSWNVGNVTSMPGMFDEATAFNQPLDTWNTAEVTNMERMFENATSFNQPLNSWNVSKVTNMSALFNNAVLFNYPLSNWNTSKVSNFGASFAGATAFNQPLNTWDTSSAVSMHTMFNDATSFNQPLNNWDVSKVNSFSGMFARATSFNQPLSNWNTQSAEAVDDMFSGASAFDQSLASFNMSNVLFANRMLDTEISTNNYDATLISWSNQQLQSNVTLQADALYCLAGDARASIVATFNWTINDEGSACGQLGVNGTQTSLTVYGNFQPGESVGNLVTSGFSTTLYSISCANPGSDDNLFAIGGSGSDELITVNGLDHRTPTDSDLNGSYVVCVKARDGLGRLVEQNITITVKAEKIILDAAFDEVNGRKTLIVSGEGLIDEAAGEFQQVLFRSLVTLNGTPLPFCSDGLGVTAQEAIEMYGESGLDIEGLVSDDPPCYYIIDDSSNPLLTSTEARIYLPDNFDLTATGTVSVNDSNTYTFNATNVPVDPTNPTNPTNITPTVFANAETSLNENPVLSSRPTFSGVATPGARIVVTVFSDPISCSAVADSSGNWSCTLPENLPPGQHTVYVQVTNPDNSIVNLGPFSVTVNGGVSATLNSSTPLAPNTGLLQTIREYKESKARNHMYMLVAGSAFLSSLIIVIFTLRYRTTSLKTSVLKH